LVRNDRACSTASPTSSCCSSTAVTLAWSGGVTFVLKVVGAFVPLRVSQQHELEGLDISQRGEALQVDLPT
jgi:ammonia channel protein AmtB